jgi:hypothetical protein
MANATGLEVRESGRALRFHTETPHLVSTGSGRLSTTVTLHPLPEGTSLLARNPLGKIIKIVHTFKFRVIELLKIPFGFNELSSKV